MIRRPPRSTRVRSSAASDVYKRQVDDLGLVDREAVVVGRGQAGGGTDGAIDVGEETARPAHDVVVVVTDTRFVARHGARRLDAPYQSRGSQRTQHVVHCLLYTSDAADDLTRVDL